MLFLMLAATTPTSIYGGVETVHPFIRIGFPVILAVVGVLGFLFLRHNRGRRMSPRRARRLIREASWVSGITGGLCCLWPVPNWLAAPPETHTTGRTACGESVCPYGSISGVPATLKKKNHHNPHPQ